MTVESIDSAEENEESSEEEAVPTDLKEEQVLNNAQPQNALASSQQFKLSGDSL